MSSRQKHVKTRLENGALGCGALVSPSVSARWAHGWVRVDALVGALKGAFVSALICALLCAQWSSWQAR
jgi:hypothetical protein